MPENQQKPRVMVFAGAGASAGLHMPTTPGFVSLLRKQWRDCNPLLERYQKYRKEIDPIKTSRDPIDAEELRDWLIYLERIGEDLDFLCGHHPFNANKKYPAETHTFLSEVRKEFDDLIRTTYGEVNPHKAHSHYAWFFNSLFQHTTSPISFFTTNYDLALESLAKYPRINWHIETGKTVLGTSMTLDLTKFQYEVSTNPTINVFKLHGSTDWWRNTETKEIECMRFGIKPPPEYEELLIYPTRDKFEQVNEPPFSSLYNILRSHLDHKNLSLCIVIGYSFRDVRINEIFMPMMQRGLRMLILDNNARAIKNHVTQIFNLSKASQQLHIEEIDFGGNTNNKANLANIFEQELQIKF